MNEVKHIGNLPKSLQVLAKEIDRGKASTKFWECSSTKELEDLAKDKKCQLECVMDPSTRRGFLTGFEVEDKGIINLPGKTQFYTMIVYFIELLNDDFKRYDAMLRKHRRQQELSRRKHND